MRRMLAVAALLALGIIGAASSATSASTGGAAQAAPQRARHLVVWDQQSRRQHGVHLWAAHRDGSHARKIYTSRHGFTTELSLDRRGRRVAFANCCQSRLPALVVVPVAGGPALKPLAHQPRFYAVGGIGWSPHGSRLVFEGYTLEHGRPTSALWTVRPDGTALRRLLPLDDPVNDDSLENEALAWTREGVLYCDRRGLRLAHDGHSRPLIRNVYSVRISGDGRHIVTERYDRAAVRDSIWFGDADGTHQRRLWLGPDTTTSGAARYREPIPDFHGRRLLTSRSTEDDVVVDWPVARRPADARELGFLSQAFGYAWN